MAHCPHALLEIDEHGDAAGDQQAHPPALSLHELRQVDDHARKRREVGAEALEQLIELRDYEDQQDQRDDDRNHQHGCRVEQGLLDLLLESFGLFLVGRHLVEQVLERTSLLAGLDEVDVEVVEIQRVLGQRLMQRAAALDVELDIEDPASASQACRARRRRSRTPAPAGCRPRASSRAGG